MTRRFKEDYEKTLENVGTLKNKMNELELKILKDGSIRDGEDSRELRLMIEELDALVDSLISRNGLEWEEYRALERECGASSVDLSELGRLKAVCEKTESLAKDLLCYSLGRFRRENVRDNSSV